MKTFTLVILFVLTAQLTSLASDYQPALIIPRSTLEIRLMQWENYAGLFRFDPVAYAYVNGKISVYQELLALLPPDRISLDP